MVKHSDPSLDLSFKALSDPTRRAILARVAKGDQTVGDIAKPFNMSLAAVSKHLQVLERAKLVKKIKSGRVITCRATLEPLRDMTAVLEELGRYWNTQLDALEKFLSAEFNEGDSNEHATERENPVTGGTKGGSGKTGEGV